MRDFYKRLFSAIFCRHAHTIRERDADGSYHLRCVTCERRWEWLSVASRTVVPRDLN